MKEFVNLVKRMREAQKEYFRTRQPEALKFSKSMEAKVDRAIETINNPKLF